MYDIYNVLYYDKMVIQELDKQVIKLYPTPYKIFDTSVNDYLFVDDVFQKEKEAYENLIYGRITTEENDLIFKTEKFKDYHELTLSYVREYLDTEITINSASANIDITGRTYDIVSAEESSNLKIKQNFVWISGAENIPGCIKQRTELKDVFSYFFKNENDEIEVKKLEKYKEGMNKPYYTQDDEYTYMWLDHFSGGSGTQANPYLVSTRADFELIRTNLSSYFRQTSDIDFGGQSNPWAPLSTYADLQFTGQYDGQNYSIKNIYYSNIVSTTRLKYSVFPICFTACVIKNVIIDNLYVKKLSDGNLNICPTVSSGSTYENNHLCNSYMEITSTTTLDTNPCNVSFIGSASNTISKCSSYNNTFKTLSASDQSAGVSSCAAALIANTQVVGAFSVSECYSLKCICEGRYASALIGSYRRVINQMTITKCYTLDCVIGLSSNLYSSAIITNLVDASRLNIDNCYFSAVINGVTKRIDFARSNAAPTLSTAYFFNLYYDSTIFTGSFLYLSSTYLKAKTTAQMQQQATFVGFDFSTVWRFNTLILYPTYPDLRNNPRILNPIVIPTVIRGYLKINNTRLPYYNFGEFVPSPVVIFKNSSGNLYGFILDPTSNVLIGGNRIKKA